MISQSKSLANLQKLKFAICLLIHAVHFLFIFGAYLLRSQLHHLVTMFSNGGEVGLKI